MNNSQIKTVFFLFTLFLINNLSARENINKDGSTTELIGNTPSNGSGKAPTSCVIGNSKIELDINNVRALLLNGGDMWWDQGGTNNARYEIPKLDDPTKVKKHSLFAGAIWIGGVDAGSGTVLVAAETYRQGNTQSFFPGPIVDAVNVDISAEECVEWNFHSKVEAVTIEEFVANFDTLNPNISDISDEILLWPGRNNPFLKEKITSIDIPLAPFIDVNGDGNYDPTKGDYPDIKGDQAVWWVLNDVGGDKRLGSGLIADAIGLEIHTLAFAFATNNSINDMTFYKNTIKNKGNKILNETYIGQWVDADLGNFDDDYVGCDIARGLGICYNGKEIDAGFRGYGENPPAIGVDFFKGPLADANDGIDNDHDCEVDEEGETIIMTKFLYYNNNASAVNGNPRQKSHFYNYLRNIWLDNTIVTYDGASGISAVSPTTPAADYMFPFDSDLEFGWGFGGNCAIPVIGGNNIAWDENTAGNDPSDRRFLQSAGPFTLEPGAVNEITIGVVWCRAGSGGPTGSLNCLKVADDAAQALFDRNFQLLSGPNSPDVGVVELDQEIILSLVPDSFLINSVEYTTETYQEIDNRLEALGAKNPYYKFQGYEVYQLSGSDVTVSDLGNTDKAQLIAQSDIQDGIGTLINSSFDPDVEQFIATVGSPAILNAADVGLFHTLKITQDKFTSKNLVNWKKYYFTVIAYGYNVDPVNDVITKDGQQYLAGRKNVQVYTVIPHKVENRNGGTILNSQYGSGLDITRINGVGNGGNDLALTAASEASIVQKFNDPKPVYKGGNSPVNIKVYDPINVKKGNFKLKLFSRIVYPLDNLSKHFEVGDTIVAVEITENDLPNFSLIGDSTMNSKEGDLPQLAGKAVIREILSIEEKTFSQEIYDTTNLDTGAVVGRFSTVEVTNMFVTAKIEMVNDSEFGTFMYDFKRFEPSKQASGGVTGPGTIVTVPSFAGYDEQGYVFFEQDSTMFTSQTQEFDLNEYWELYDLTNQSNIDASNTVIGDKRISQFNEQLLPEYGIAIELRGVKDPLYRVIDNIENGFLSADIVYGENGNGIEWIGVPNINPLNFLQEDYDPWMDLIPNPNAVDENDVDPAGTYRRVLDGMWTSYSLVRSGIDDNGATYVRGENNGKIYDLANIDIVITSDESKWTKCVVLDYDKATNSPFTKLLKSTKGNGTGMGTFPGYVIDLDRGIRLNMFFAESEIADSIDGADLVWNPTFDKAGSRSYIYVTSTEYDEGLHYATEFDDIKNSFSPNSINASSEYVERIFNDITWTGNIKVADATFMASDVTRIRLRVNKQYRSTGILKSPEYEFSTEGAISTTEDLATADSALQLIRMVPNPYYATSDFESGQFDNIVKITNLPRECILRIYNLGGNLVRVYNKSNDATFIDWDLTNENGLAIGSGVYFLHIEVPGVGTHVVKWFGTLRPFDLDTF